MKCVKGHEMTEVYKKAPAYKAYAEATASANKAYWEATEPAYKAYMEATKE